MKCRSFFGRKTMRAMFPAIAMVLAVALAGGAVKAANNAISALLKGQTAPFSGILVSEDVYKEYLQLDADYQAERSKRESLERELEQTKAALMSQIKQLEAEKAGVVAERDKCQYAMAHPELLDRPNVNRWIGFGLGVGVCAGAVYGAGQLH